MSLNVSSHRDSKYASTDNWQTESSLKNVIYFKCERTVSISGATVHPFHSVGYLLYPAKRSENQKFSEVYSTRPVASNGLMFKSTV